MMSWYFQHQRARDIIAERERHADRIRLARLYDEGHRAAQPASSGRSPIRRGLGAVVLAVGGTTTRVGQALTRVGHAVDGAETSPTA